MKKYRVLVIAPYEGFTGIVQNVVNDHREFSVLDLDIEMLTLNRIEDFLRRTRLSAYDVVISRGQSAAVAESVLDGRVPIVNIGFSPYDILRSLKLAMNSSSVKMAFLVFPNISSSVLTLFELISGSEKVQLVVPTAFRSEEEMEQCIIQLHEQEGVNLFIGDGVCNRLARAHEYDNILITSGPESVCTALERALKICENRERKAAEQNLMETIIRKSQVPLAIYDQYGTLLLCNFHSIGPEYSDLDLRPYVERSLRHQETKHIINIGRQSFRIRSSCVECGGEEYVVFLVVNSFNRTPKNRQLYDIITRNDAQDSLVYMVNSLSLSSLLERVTSTPQSKLSIFVHGERSSGKSTFIKAVYASSQYSHSPMIVIDCLQLNEELLSRLFEDDRSALLERDCVVYFKNIHVLTTVLQNRLEYYLKASSLASRHKLLTSFTGDLDAALAQGKFSTSLYHYLAGTSVQIPSISNRSLDIPNIVRICLNQINQKMPVQIASIDQGAMRLLKNFCWTNGIDQLNSVIQELAASSESQVIKEEQVARLLKILSSQHHQLSSAREASALDLTRPLAEIEQEIIEIVFREENMNQTRAAQRLGISRTSLWKKLNRKSGESVL